MANTFPAGAICNVCCDVGLSALCQQVGPLNFWNECGPDPMCPGRPVVVPIGTAGTAAQIATNATNFETGDTTLTVATVTPVYINKSFHISATQYQQCYRLSKLAAINADLFVQAIMAQINPLLTATNFPATAVTDTVSTWGPGSLKKVYGALKCSPKHLLIDPALFASVMFTTTGGCCYPLTGTNTGPAAYGFQSISENSYWVGAPAGTMGFGYCPQAIIMVSGTPEMPPACSSVIESRNITVPGLGLTAQFNLWCSTATRNLWGSYDIIFGAALGVACAGVLIVPSGALLAAEAEAPQGRGK